MTEAVESGLGAMQTESREIEAFHYTESPWMSSLAGSGDPLPELFPESKEPESHGSSRPGSDWAYAPDRERGSDPQSYTYGIDPSFAFEGRTENGTEDSGQDSDPSDSAHKIEDNQLFQQLLTSEGQKAEERGRSKGMEIGLALGREEALRQLGGERERLVAQAKALFDSFSRARERYLDQLEQEAVKLALAIAARVLRREAQMDSLLLTGAVRVALGQLAASTSVRLRVPAQDQPMWEEAMARMPGLPLRPQVIGDPRMVLGDCLMETELGSADLGLWPQLKAIERGFFERPGDQSGDRARDQTGNRSGLDGNGVEPADRMQNFAAADSLASDRPIHGNEDHGNVD